MLSAAAKVRKHIGKRTSSSSGLLLLSASGSSTSGSAAVLRATSFLAAAAAALPAAAAAAAAGIFCGRPRFLPTTAGGGCLSGKLGVLHHQACVLCVFSRWSGFTCSIGTHGL